MSKFENFSQRISHHQQQIESENLRQSAIEKQKWRELKEKQVQEMIQAQKEADERVKKNKEIFGGTGIIECFQEIIDNKILIFATIGKDWYKKNFLGIRVRGGTQEIIPAKIDYQLNQVDLKYNARYKVGGEYEPACFTCNTISVIKNVDSSFNLRLPGCPLGLYDYEKLTSEESIDQIAQYIAASGDAGLNCGDNFDYFSHIRDYYEKSNV